MSDRMRSCKNEAAGLIKRRDGDDPIIDAFDWIGGLFKGVHNHKKARSQRPRAKFHTVFDRLAAIDGHIGDAEDDGLTDGKGCQIAAAIAQGPADNKPQPRHRMRKELAVMNIGIAINPIAAGNIKRRSRQKSRHAANDHGNERQHGHFGGRGGGIRWFGGVKHGKAFRYMKRFPYPYHPNFPPLGGLLIFLA